MQQLSIASAALAAAEAIAATMPSIATDCMTFSGASTVHRGLLRITPLRGSMQAMSMAQLNAHVSSQATTTPAASSTAPAWSGNALVVRSFATITAYACFTSRSPAPIELLIYDGATVAALNGPTPVSTPAATASLMAPGADLCCMKRASILVGPSDLATTE